MSYLTQVFMGARIRDFQSSIGWGIGAPSQLRIQLVEDKRLGDVFTPLAPGVPAYFQFYDFNFSGLVQRYEKQNSISGLPVYEVMLVDPREILEGAQLIIGGYSGSVNSINNLYNVFGYWENALGFGGSEINETGMPWRKIRDAVLNICNSPAYTNYGGPLTYKGYTYSLDLSQLPSPPEYYRIGGNNISLLEAIAMVCEDGGCDFVVELHASTIKIRTISRSAQPPLGTITTLANSYSASTLSRSSSGLESRNEITSAFLIGGEQTAMYSTDENSIFGFWGFDINGKAITDTAAQVIFFDDGTSIIINTGQAYAHAGSPVYTADTRMMNLNSSPISDITASTIYQCTTLEMRFAMHNYNSWAMYIENTRPNIAALIASPFKNMAGINGALRNEDLINDDPLVAAKINAIDTDYWIKALRIYEFVRSYADEYYGRKYLVSLPFVLRKVDSDSLRITNSYEVTDGGFMPEGSDSQLGLSDDQVDIFQLPDGRLKSIVQYDAVIGANLSKISPHGTFIDVANSILFEEIQVNPQLVFNPLPYAIITIPSPVQEEADDAFGGMPLIMKALLHRPEAKEVVANPGQPGRKLMNGFESFDIRCEPAMRDPTWVAIALKSNILTYGPWYAQGIPGKVKLEHDPSLTPWNYGGFDVMDFAGNARVATAITNMAVSETGYIEIAGPPTASLGDTLQSGGPNLTNIDVSYGINGVTTNYRFQTYSPRFGVFGKSYLERIKRLSVINHDMRRTLKQAMRADDLRKAAIINTLPGFVKNLLNNAPKAVAKRSPHSVLIGYNQWANDPLSTGDLRTGVSASTLEEAVSLAHGDDANEFNATSIMSMTGLVRPFCTNPFGGSRMSTYSIVTNSGVALNKNNLDPFKAQNDIEAYLWSSTYEGIHAYRRQGSYDNARVLALRGPLLISGWGYNIGCAQIPNSGGQTWRTDYLKRSDLWSTGPMDALFDQYAGTWTVHGTRLATTSDTIPANGSGICSINENGVNFNMFVKNYFSTAVSSGVKAICSYIPTHNSWYITSADCS